MWRYFDDVKFKLLSSAILSALTFISAIALMGASGWLISRAAQMPPVLELSVAVVAVRTFALSRAATRYAERLVSHSATFESLTKIRSDLYLKLETLAPSGLTAFRHGDLMARLVADVDEIQNLPLRVVIPISSGIIASVFAVIGTVLLLPSAGILLLGTLLFAGTAVPYLAIRTAATSEYLTATTRGELTEELNAFYTGNADLQMLDATTVSLDRLTKLDSDLTVNAKRLANGLGISNALGTLAQGIAVIGSTILGVLAVNSGDLKGELLVVLALIPMAAFEAVMAFSNAALSLSRVRGSAERICEVLDAIVPVIDQATENVEIGSQLELLEVSATWPLSDRIAISGINLAAAKGTKTAVVGRSGSGKSTVAAVLAQFLHPSDGKYMLGGQDSRFLSGETVRSHVTLSTQDSYIFATSISENLKLAWHDANTPPTDEQIWDALEKALLTDWVRSLPDGIHTVIGERGTNMSGGQRQRLVAARMFLASPDIWVLDEPTEHLNDELADALIQNLASAATTNVLIVSTHRILDTKNFDDVLVLADGALVEGGSPDELSASSGTYALLLKREEVARTKLQSH